MYDCTVITLDTDTDHSVRAYIMENGTLAIHDHKRKRQTLLMQADWNSHDLGVVGSVLARSIARSAIVLRDMHANDPTDAEAYDSDLLIESIREGLYVMLHDGIPSSDRCIAMANALRTSIVASIKVERMNNGLATCSGTVSRTVRDCLAKRRAGKGVAK